jgi:hypothetical protein
MLPPQYHYHRWPHFLYLFQLFYNIASTTSCKFMSYRKMLYKLIKNPSTNSWFYTHMINKNKHYFMFFFLSILCFNLKASLGLGILVNALNCSFCILCHTIVFILFLYVTMCDTINTFKRMPSIFTSNHFSN